MSALCASEPADYRINATHQGYWSKPRAERKPRKQIVENEPGAGGSRFAGAGTARRSPAGLLKDHLSPLTSLDRRTDHLTGAVVKVAEGGSLVVCSFKGGHQDKPRLVPKRGKIQGFTIGAARRMRRQVKSINRNRVGADQVVFIALTYPSEFPAARATKKHLDTFLKRFRRLHPGAAGWWKLEPQRRGAPHYHLLLVVPGGYHLQELRSWCSSSWYEVVGSGDVKHLKAGTRVDQVKDWRGVDLYLSKYVAKPVETDDLDPTWVHPGKWWGVFNRKGLPIDIQTARVTPEGVPVMLRVMRHVRRWYESRPSSWCWFFPRHGGRKKVTWKHAKKEDLARHGKLQRIKLRRLGKGQYPGGTFYLADGDFRRLVRYELDRAGLSWFDVFEPVGGASC